MTKLEGSEIQNEAKMQSVLRIAARNLGLRNLWQRNGRYVETMQEILGVAK